MGQFSPHLHHSAFGGAAAPGIGCSGAWGSIFMGGLELVGVTVLLVGGIRQSFLNSKRFSDIFPALGHGVIVHELGHFLVVGGLFPGVPSVEGFCPSEFFGVLGYVRGGCAHSHCWNWAWLLPSPYIFLHELISSSFQLL